MPHQYSKMCGFCKYIIFGHITSIIKTETLGLQTPPGSSSPGLSVHMIFTHRKKSLTNDRRNYKFLGKLDIVDQPLFFKKKKKNEHLFRKENTYLAALSILTQILTTRGQQFSDPENRQSSKLRFCFLGSSVFLPLFPNSRDTFSQRKFIFLEADKILP